MSDSHVDCSLYISDQCWLTLDHATVYSNTRALCKIEWIDGRWGSNLITVEASHLAMRQMHRRARDYYRELASNLAKSPCTR